MSNFHMLFLDDADRSFFVDGHFRSGDGLGPEVLRLAESVKRDFEVELRLRVKEVDAYDLGAGRCVYLAAYDPAEARFPAARVVQSSFARFGWYHEGREVEPDEEVDLAS